MIEIPMTNDKNSRTSTAESHTIEEMVKNTCMCKLRESCPDKHSKECLRDRNLYAEFMLARETR
jgi:hypothetical protein